MKSWQFTVVIFCKLPLKQCQDLFESAKGLSKWAQVYYETKLPPISSRDPVSIKVHVFCAIRPERCLDLWGNLPKRRHFLAFIYKYVTKNGCSRVRMILKMEKFILGIQNQDIFFFFLSNKRGVSMLDLEYHPGAVKISRLLFHWLQWLLNWALRWNPIDDILPFLVSMLEFSCSFLSGSRRHKYEPVPDSWKESVAVGERFAFVRGVEPGNITWLVQLVWMNWACQETSECELVDNSKYRNILSKLALQKSARQWNADERKIWHSVWIPTFSFGNVTPPIGFP